MTVSLAGIAVANARRWEQVDPALPPSLPLEEGDDGRIITAQDGPSRAAGLIRTLESAPEDFASCFVALRHHSLRAQVDGPDPAAAMTALLSAWRGLLGGEAAEAAARAARPPGRSAGRSTGPEGGLDPVETAASLSWPSRDTTAVGAFARFGLVPTVVVALRRSTRHSASLSQPADGPAVPAMPARLTIRPAREADLDAVVELQLAALRFDAALGTCTIRPQTPDTLRQRLASSLAEQDGTHLLARLDGEPVGLAIVTPPERAGWIAGLVRAERVGYVECLSVREGRRGHGIGGALVAAAHRRLDEADADAILLHHALVNPLSTPFWHTQGYRPLWTQWHARPGTPLLGSGGV